MLWRRIHFVAIVLIGALAAVTAARADDFYKGKNFTIVVGFSPGGGYDTYTRNVARYIGKHMPGHPSVSPETSWLRPPSSGHSTGSNCESRP